MKVDVGLVGLAVMGKNLALNLADKGFKVAVFNRSHEKTTAFINTEAKHTAISGFSNLQEFVANLTAPRKIILMVKAGTPVDDVIEELLPFLAPNDIIIDGGNSYFQDTNRRIKYLNSKNILYVGMGVSGGEEGARHGPSLMPGGNFAAWKEIEPFCRAIAAKVDNKPCVDWIGDTGSGHFVKMVHNGIEYADMEIIAETYQLMRDTCSLSNSQMADVFAGWNKGVLNSFLIEITANILGRVTSSGHHLVDDILDVAEQKGTGKWTIESAMDLGVPTTLISEAVFSRSLSSLYKVRRVAAELHIAPKKTAFAEVPKLVEALEQAMYFAKIVSYAQGFLLLEAAAERHNWSLNKINIALSWRGGCIIRSKFLNDIAKAYEKNPALQSLLFDDFFASALKRGEESLRFIIQTALSHAIPVPVFSAALAFFDALRAPKLPTNLIQAQRDYFGAHTFEQIRSGKGIYYHADWFSPNPIVVKEVK